LDKIQESYKQFELGHDAKLLLLRDEIVQLANLKNKLGRLEQDMANSVRRMEVLKSLYFPVLQRRWNRVHQAVAMSNKWIFNPGTTEFTEWLHSKEQRDRFFVITGRVSL
jgi:hypothetical protein